MLVCTCIDVEALKLATCAAQDTAIEVFDASLKILKPGIFAADAENAAKLRFVVHCFSVIV